MKHLIGSEQFEYPFLEKLFTIAEQMREDSSSYRHNGKVLASIFYEPSTRTRMSFESAMVRLGGSVISTENAKEFSSFSKGETLEDSIKVLSGYADIIALRHFEIGAAKRAASVSKVPIINAGDGAGEHPTQALLDLYTIQRRFSEVNGLTICMVGDLKYGRTVRSLCKVLGKFFQVKLIFVAPKICEMEDDIKDFLDERKVSWREEKDLKAALQDADCVYMTRVQKERFLDIEKYKVAVDQYKIDRETLPFLKKDAIVMHPLPRLSEISTEIDNDPRVVCFEQAHNGLWVRMALMHILLNNDGTF